jgi:hypothetical protein
VNDDRGRLSPSRSFAPASIPSIASVPVDAFEGADTFADSVNHMLVVGFYLLELGIVLLRMRSTQVIADFEAMIVHRAQGLGAVLGLLHFFNRFVIHQYGRLHLSSSRMAHAGCASDDLGSRKGGRCPPALVEGPRQRPDCRLRAGVRPWPRQSRSRCELAHPCH